MALFSSCGILTGLQRRLGLPPSDIISILNSSMGHPKLLAASAATAATSMELHCLSEVVNVICINGSPVSRVKPCNFDLPVM